ncbi:MAG: acyl-phosphate glycerol 3-phosphate acyltransferase [Robiginitomaculum sp.]|nr:MAG: acyl-phosphate glycerol 3-phosphate acyltransferase [Robiginitomaculum sp.]
MLPVWGLAAIGGYLLGSLPFGILLTRWFGVGDIRQIGSGNIGATNVLRTGRKDLALATVLLDAGKAAAAYWLVLHLLEGATFATAMFAALCALIGHCYPVWLKFKGGKGVATFFGGVFIADWQLGLIVGMIWLIVAFSMRISSLAALIAVNGAPALALAMGRPDLAVFIGLMALVISFRHLENIRRLIAGTEPKFGSKDKK